MNGTILALTIPTVAGFLFASWLLKNDEEISIFERIFLGYGLGLGFLSYGMFIEGLLGIEYTLFNVIIVQIIFILAMFTLIAYSKTPLRKIFAIGSAGFSSVGKWQWYLFSGILLVWILFKVSFVLYEGLSRPVYGWDAWSIWSSGAKFFYYEKGLSLDPSNEFFFGTGYRAVVGYPLHTPLVGVWISLFLGEFHDIYSKAWEPFYFIALIGVFFFAAKRKTNNAAALIGTTLLSSAPLLTFHATDAYSDLPMAYYGFCGAICFLRYMGTGGKNLLILSGIFLGMGIFVKNEGVFFAAATATSLGAFLFSEKKGLRAGLAYFIIPIAIISGPWLLFKAIYGLSYAQGIQQGFLGLKITAQAAKEFLKVMTLEANFNMIYPFLFIITVLRPRILFKDDTRYLFIIIIFIAAIFFFAYTMSAPVYAALITRTAVNRNILTWLPLVYFLAVIGGFRLLYKEEGGK